MIRRCRLRGTPRSGNRTVDEPAESSLRSATSWGLGFLTLALMSDSAVRRVLLGFSGIWMLWLGGTLALTLRHRPCRTVGRAELPIAATSGLADHRHDRVISSAVLGPESHTVGDHVEVITSGDTERSVGWHRRLREAHIPGTMRLLQPDLIGDCSAASPTPTTRSTTDSRTTRFRPDRLTRQDSRSWKSASDSLFRRRCETSTSTSPTEDSDLGMGYSASEPELPMI